MNAVNRTHTMEKNTPKSTSIAKKSNAPSTKAQHALGGVFFNAIVAKDFGLRTTDAVAASDVYDVLENQAKAIHAGDLEKIETMLHSQACALESIFAELARRGANNMGHNLEVAERYLRLALKAQGQSRATLEALANMKRPPTLFANQANIAHGPQQVNNEHHSSTRARKKPKSVQNELLVESKHGSKKVDTRTTRKAAAGDPTLATVDTVHRTGQHRRAKKIVAQCLPRQPNGEPATRAQADTTST